MFTHKEGKEIQKWVQELEKKVAVQIVVQDLQSEEVPEYKCWLMLRLLERELDEITLPWD